MMPKKSASAVAATPKRRSALSKEFRAQKAWEEEMSRARLRSNDPNRISYTRATRNARHAYDEIMNESD